MKRLYELCVCVCGSLPLVSVGSGEYKIQLILLGLKYPKRILLADNPMVIHMPTFVVPKGPVLWVVLHCRL